MKAPQRLNRFGQSLWLDGIPGGLLNSGTFKRCIDQWLVSGLTLNARILTDAIKDSSAYDAAMRRKLREDKMSGTLSLNAPYSPKGTWSATRK